MKRRAVEIGLSRRILVTGGAGFIGSALCLHLVLRGRHRVLNLDKLTYAANPASLAELEGRAGYRLAIADICDQEGVARLISEFRPEIIFHLAAESHVDRSIDGPEAFMQTNIVGTQRLLSATLAYWRGLPAAEASGFRFVHVSTDEVYGSLGPSGLFTEESPYRPNSPYSASKAASDHLAHAWHATYGLPVIISNCSNNYGPRQFPEKLIPHVIIRAIDGDTLPVYGQGLNIRDWLFVEDHVAALVAVAERGQVGEKYNVGGHGERRNFDVVQGICRHLDHRRPLARGSYADRIVFVKDRPGHDLRYAIDPSKSERELGWRPSVDFEAGLAQTIDWYLEHETWWRTILAHGYQPARIGQLADISTR
ncbi:dTDP-glucose 4,6-dehydratase [Dongia sp.]|uniref:dTDP-glucose 4,6-dehydratase n=1 Tax=Dongia sp. TaxID=1977262 RepID=UPI0035B28686